MMSGAVEAILERVKARSHEPVLWEAGSQVTGAQLLEHSTSLMRRLEASGIGAGSVIGFCGDYGLATVGAFLALFQLKATAVPFSPGVRAELPTLCSEAQVEFWLEIESGAVSRMRGTPSEHPLLGQLRQSGNPGLIVFTSGSSGKAKAILHDVERVAAKFVKPRRGWRMVLFLLIDHFGGFNTLLACLGYGGTGVCVGSRTPSDVCEAIAASRAELLPTTPTFLALLISSGVWRRCDLSSVQLVTYGAEPMPESTLKRLPEVFRCAEFKQTYGLSELGVLPSASPQLGSLWLRMGGQDFETRIVSGVLHIRARSNMLGYLNAASPIDAEGWMNTGDVVEVDGDMIKVVGRESDVINVGGQKVFPTEVEAVLLEDPDVAQATVFAISHPVLGQVVGARISLLENDDTRQATLFRLKAHCKSRLQKYKVPMRFEVVDLERHGSDRGKKIRR